MAEYKAIHGTLFQHKTSDPLDTGLPGATWSSGCNMNTARATKGTTAGTQTASGVFGGQTSTAYVAIHEQYNGTAWTEVGDLSTARGTVAGGNAGPNKATWLQGGYIPGQSPNAYSTVLTEEWSFVHAIKTVTTS